MEYFIVKYHKPSIIKPNKSISVIFKVWNMAKHIQQRRILGSLSIQEVTLINMKSAIQKYNSKNLAQLSEADFRRLAIELLSQLILKDLPIPIALN